MQKRIRLGIIGTGICASSFHLPALRGLQDHFEVTAVCSADPVQGRRFAEEAGTGVSFFSEPEELLASPRVEAALSSYPYFLSEKIIRLALAQGKHILVEKPLTDSIDTARALAGLPCNGLIAGVAENWIYLNAVPRLKTLLQDGEIGSLRWVLLTSLYRMDENSEYLTKSRWRQTAKGGMILDRAIHAIALEHAVVGRVDAVCGLPCSVRSSLGQVDTLSAVFRHRSGVAGSLTVCASAPGLDPGYSLALVGTEGTIRARKMFTELLIETGDKSRCEMVDNEDNGYRAELLDFYNAIREGRPMESNLQNAAEDLCTALAALENPASWVSL